ncbi:MAG: glutathione S-transferase family protein [Pseudomonadota bacterium]
MIKIWGRPTSICTQRALWALTEAKVNYELTLSSGTMGQDGHVSTGASPFGNVSTDWYEEMNPNRTVPTIDDDGYVLWESNAIVTYIALKYGEGVLTDGSTQTFARATQWMSWTNENLEPALHILVMELKRLRPDLRTDGEIEKALERITPSLNVLDRHLATNDYVAGASFTLGDIPTAAAAYRWIVFDQPGPDIPNIRAWLSHLGQRPAFVEHVAPVDYHV